MQDRTLEKSMYKLGWISLGVFLLLAGIYRFFWLPILHLPCMMDRLLGLYCPGCGGTRAMQALFHGKLLSSLWYHPLVLYTAVIYSGFMISQTLERLHIIKRGWKFYDWYLYAAAGLLFGNCIVKNVLRLFFHIAMV